MSSISFSNVSKSYAKVKVIQDFSLQLENQEFVTLLGPSGCGKTTLLRMLAGFEKPTAGVISIDGRIVSGPDCFVEPEERGIGMVFQSYAVWPHMNVFDNIGYPLKIHHVGAEESKRRVEEILASLGLAGLAQRMPNELSGGQQQRVALGRALASSPSLLLLDEPLSNLDAKLRETMRFEIKAIQKRLGITVIYVTHDQTEAMAMSDRVVVLKDGRMQQVDSPMRLYQAPVNPFVADFVGKISFLEARAQAGFLEFSGGQRLNYAGDKRGEVVVAVRPENVRLSAEQGVLPGILEHTQYLGDVNDCRVAVQGASGKAADVRVILSGRSFGQWTAGSSVWLDFDDYLVFEKGSIVEKY